MFSVKFTLTIVFYPKSNYTIDFTLKWQNKSAIIRTGWIIENNSKIPRLTTCYPL
ncbi:DUF6883 domain-containing protein [Crocosphaera watsonii WH 8501]|uniref:DUF6883 domain-containing protein n=1 Tax=Crocosphaera watsonii TaxID=263511 RepID=UPI0012F4D69A|nr:DUF6883 domain-containing protein [Crocosphaera watsonii]